MHPALAAFEPLPLKERLFVRARALSAPLEAMAARVTGKKVVDLGCGHGVLAAMLAVGFPDREVVGVDPDPRKIAWARASVGRYPNARFQVGTAQSLAEAEPGAFDCAVVADVLYLLPPEQWVPFLEACRRLLVPGGRLVLKEAEDDGTWRVKKALWQERVMVRLLRRTKGSGGLGFHPRGALEAALRAAGFEVLETAPLGRFSTTPHVLFVAECG